MRESEKLHCNCNCPTKIISAVLFQLEKKQKLFFKKKNLYLHILVHITKCNVIFSKYINANRWRSTDKNRSLSLKNTWAKKKKQTLFVLNCALKSTQLFLVFFFIIDCVLFAFWYHKTFGISVSWLLFRLRYRKKKLKKKMRRFSFTMVME